VILSQAEQVRALRPDAVRWAWLDLEGLSQAKKNVFEQRCVVPLMIMIRTEDTMNRNVGESQLLIQF
jgi:hypothetical protein